MTRLFLFLTLFLAFVSGRAEDYIESFNVISDNYVNDIHDAQIIRNINGGTVIIPVFDDSCPEEMKAPFSYACKIVEEYLPPCLPLTARVSCGQPKGSSIKAISKVSARSKEYFGASPDYDNVQMSVIKGVVLAELSHSSTVTYYDYIPDLEFLTGTPDIEITYNRERLDEISFSLEADPGNNYDFVSLVIRDLLIGLGLSSSYRYDNTNSELLDPSHIPTPFEYFVNRMLGNYGNPVARLKQATKGELQLRDFDKYLKLYAPSPWQNGVSLNYFIPQDDSCVSKILSYNFCKGMVTRTLSDGYSDFIFRILLGWKANYSVSVEKDPSVEVGGSTSLLMPYNGSISFNNTGYGINAIIDPSLGSRRVNSLNSGDEEIRNYVYSFDPFLCIEEFDLSDTGTSISVLKKDGSWDLVKYIPGYGANMSFSMSDWDFNYEEEQYARTIDGYLRARISTKRPEQNRIIYNTKFFVIDYIPQKVNLSFSFLDAATSRGTSNNVRIFFSNTEGLDHIVLEKLRQGNRIPSKIVITDIKKGFLDTTIDKTTTFTAVGYNANGVSRGVPVTISPAATEQLAIDFKMEDNHIYLIPDYREGKGFSYTIIPIDRELFPTRQAMYGDEGIDISTLPVGLFVLTVMDNGSGASKAFKFKR